jgi:hypothetical protein
MNTKNYYKMGKEEIADNLVKMNYWLYKYKGHSQYEKALFAYGIARKAFELHDTVEGDEFTGWIVEYLT